jgi:methylmalonyl-CoA mutase
LRWTATCKSLFPYINRQLERLQQAVIDNGNVFEVLMDAVRVCSLGQITNALFEMSGQYRRNM